MKRFLKGALAVLAVVGATAFVAPTNAPIHVPSIADLKNIRTNAAGQVIADGWYAAGDTKHPVTYTKSASACPLNSGNGDGGAQVRSADGLCWIASTHAVTDDPHKFGAKGDGTTDDTAAFQAFINAAPTGTVLECKPGTATYKLATPTTTTLLTTTGNITSGSDQLTNLASVVNIAVGETLTITGVPSGTTVTALVGTTVTMSANATATTTGVAAVFQQSQFLSLPHAVSFGHGCRFTYSGGTVNTDLIRFFPTNANDFADLRITGISYSGTGSLRHVINLDMSSVGPVLQNNLFGWSVDNNSEGAPLYGGTGAGNPGQVGHFLYLTLEPINGFYTARDGKVEFNRVSGCIYLHGMLDHLRISRNTIWYRTAGDTDCGWDVATKPGNGAGKLTIEDNTSTSNGDHTADGWVSPVITGNYIERTNTPTNATSHTDTVSADWSYLVTVGSNAGPMAVVSNNLLSQVTLTQSTLQLDNLTSIVVGQAVTGTGVPAATTVSAMGDVNHPWIQLNNAITAEILSGDTVTVNGVSHQVTRAATLGSAAIYNKAAGTLIKGNYFGSGLSDRVVTNTGTQLYIDPTNTKGGSWVNFRFDGNGNTTTDLTIGVVSRDNFHVGTSSPNSTDATTWIAVPGLAQFLAAKQYVCRGEILFLAIPVAAGVQFELRNADSLAPNFSAFRGMSFNGNTTADNNVGSLGAVITAYTGVLTNIEFTGTINVLTPGTIGVYFHQNVANASPTQVSQNSTFSCVPVN